MGRPHKDISNNLYGDYEIIGDTGKRDKGGNAIVIARNLKTGKLKEGLAQNFKSNNITGFIGSEENLNNLKKMKVIRKQNGIHENHFGKERINKTGYSNIIFRESKMRWRVNTKFQNKIYDKYFIKFSEAVIYMNKIQIEIMNNHITNKNLKFKKIHKDEINLNEYVKSTQNLINTSIIEKEKKRRLNSGIHWDKRNKKWHVQFSINNKNVSYGYFKNEQQAIEARQKAVDEQIKILEKQLEEL